MLTRLSAAAFAFLALSAHVAAQTIQTTPPGLPVPTTTKSTTSRSSTKTSTSSYHYTYSVCNQVLTVSAEGTAVTAAIPAGVPLPEGAVCWRVYQQGGGVVSTPYTTIGKSRPTGLTATPGVTIIPTSGGSNSGSSNSSSSTSSGKNIGLIVGATIGAVAGLALIGLGLMFFRKHRKTAKMDRAWVNRPGGWVQEQQEKRHSDNIILKDRNSKDSTTLPAPRSTEV